MSAAVAGFHVMAKPTGPLCNLDCRYCYYLEKARLYPEERRWRMDDATLEAYVRRMIEAQPGGEIAFAWQGGEPTLLGVDFFRRAVALQRRLCPPGRTVSNSLQTNGTLIDDGWAAFLAEHRFLVGVSVDGPADLHDRYRVDRGGRPTHERVLRGIDRLRRHGVAFNLLCTVNAGNAAEPRRVYRFLRGLGTPFLQFIPLVERCARGADDRRLAGPPQDEPEAGAVTPWSVTGPAYGDFMTGVFDAWLARDVGEVFVQLFDVQLGIEMGLPSSLCVFAEECGRGLALEHDGSVFACDHYVYPAYRLGNLRERSLAELVDAPRQRAFGAAKRDALPGRCWRCPHLRRCWGGCPKHRVDRTANGEPGLNRLCAGYRRFFDHAAPHLRRMAELLRAGRPAAAIMAERRGGARAGRRVGPNEPCPCGSGRKHKRCHGRGGRR